MTMWINEEECTAAGVSPADVRRIARRLSFAGREARAFGIQIFGGSGSGSLRKDGYILATLDGHFDGGDGAEHQDENGMWRGE